MVDVHPADDANGNALNASLSTVDEKADDTDSTKSTVSHRGAPLPSALLMQLGTEGGDPYEKVLALLKCITERMQQVREETPVIVRSTSPGVPAASQPSTPSAAGTAAASRPSTPSAAVPAAAASQPSTPSARDTGSERGDRVDDCREEDTVESHFFHLTVDEDIVLLVPSPSCDAAGSNSMFDHTQRTGTAFLRSMPNRFPHLPHEVHEVLDTQQLTPQFLTAFSGQCFVLIEHELIPDHWYSLQLHVEAERVCVGWRWSYRPSSYRWPSWVHTALCREDEANPHRKLNDLVNTLKEWMAGTLSMAQICDARYPRIFPAGKHRLIFDLFHTATVYRDMTTDGNFSGLRCEWV